MFTALTLDFETRSSVDLKRASYRKYLRNPFADVLCVGLQFVEETDAEVVVPPEGRAVFRKGDPTPARIQYAIDHQIPIYAHNAPFDRRVYRDLCVEKYGWTPVPDHLWRCSMSVCSYYALPRALKDVATVLDLPIQKDMEGHKVMMKLAKPRGWSKKARLKAEAHGFILPTRWNEDPELLEINAEYCRRDVACQTALLRALGPLPAARLRDWQKDQQINERGCYVDVASLKSVEMTLAREKESANRDIQYVTTGPNGIPAVKTVNQREKILEFLKAEGVRMTGLRKADVEAALKNKNLGYSARRVLEIRQSAGKSSLAKVQSLIDNVDEDWRGRDSLVWHKATTGRYAGARFQPHNFPREAMKDKDAEIFHFLLRYHEDIAGCYAYNNPKAGRSQFFSLLSAALRSFITAPPGKALFISDFSAIESRILAWLSGCKLMLTAYYKQECVYSQMASKIYQRAIKDKDKGPERQMGKVAILGLGYGMGEDKFITTVDENPTVDEDLSEKIHWEQFNPWRRQLEKVTTTKGKRIVSLFRTMYPEIPKFWRDLEAGMVKAVETQSQVRVGKVVCGCRGRWAWITLPSGRPIWYRDMKVEEFPGRYNKDKVEKKLTHWTKDKNGKWCNRTTWGGTLVENVTQACAADFLQEAIHRIDDHGDFQTVLTVHDEVVSEGPETASKDEFHQMMKVVPEWGKGCPIDAETHVKKRYGK